MYRVGVLVSGNGTNLGALISTCHRQHDCEIGLVVSNNSTAGALRLATDASIPTHVLHDPNDGDALADILTSASIDLVVLAGYLKLVPAAVVTAFHGRTINIHPALLPAFGGKGMYGARVHQAVLASGATVSGPTVHLVDEVYDRGRIVAQWPVPVMPQDTPASLAARVLQAEHSLLPAVVSAAARAGGVCRLVPNEEQFSLRADADGTMSIHHLMEERCY